MVEEKIIEIYVFEKRREVYMMPAQYQCLQEGVKTGFEAAP
jgi:hypothetical protein